MTTIVIVMTTVAVVAIIVIVMMTITIIIIKVVILEIMRTIAIIIKIIVIITVAVMMIVMMMSVMMMMVSGLAGLLGAPFRVPPCPSSRPCPPTIRHFIHFLAASKVGLNPTEAAAGPCGCLPAPHTGWLWARGSGPGPLRSPFTLPCCGRDHPPLSPQPPGPRLPGEDVGPFRRV